MNPRPDLPWSEQFRIVAKQWVDAEAAASLLEDTKSAVLSERMQAFIQNGDSVSGAESKVKASPDWKQHVGEIIAARRQANLLKLQMRYLEMKFFEWNNHEATKRTEARL